MFDKLNNISTKTTFSFFPVVVIFPLLFIFFCFDVNSDDY
ncbi:hypothetical protein CUZ89_0399 [Enterococcus xinjiangensis]|nr:hypothetical protein [Enterococcus lactis]MBL4999028.1 hypothetical protein [Enterococcus lactis]MBL5002218.1 hypothetical protein [Enterococcus lactis]